MSLSALRPYFIGSNTSAGSSGSSVIQITPQVSVAAGDLIVVVTDSDMRPAAAYPSSVTDSAGNSYQAINGAYTYTNPSAACFYSQSSNPLNTSELISVNWSRATDMNAVALGCSGIATAGALDVAMANWTSGGGMTFISPPLGLNRELAVVYWVARQAQGAPQITSDWTGTPSFQGAANTHWVVLAYKVADTADPVIAAASTPGQGLGFTGLLVTFRATLTPTAALHCGGSMTALPVRAVTGTATLHCGGSMPGPEEMAPVPPPRAPAFIAGYGPLPADMENLVRRPFRWVTEQAVYRGQAAGAGQSIPASTFTPLAFGTPLEDPWGGWSSTGTSEQAANSWLAPWTGLYRVTFRWAGGTAGNWNEAAIGVSGVNPVFEAEMVPGPPGLPGGAGASVVLPLVGGADYVQALAWCSGAVTTDTSTAGRAPYMEITCVQADLLG